MEKVVIKKMESEAEIQGKGYVHYKSWHETYAGLIDADYLETQTLEKCIAIAHKWPDNILVAKDGERVAGFVGCGAYRDDTLPACGEVFAIYVLAEYHGQRVGYELMKAAIEKLSAYKKIAACASIPCGLFFARTEACLPETAPRSVGSDVCSTSVGHNFCVDC